jgi:hypothetical protein
MVKDYRSFCLNPSFKGQLSKTITCSIFMRWNPLNSNDQIQDVYFYFYVWRKFKFNLKTHVPKRNIIGHFGPIPLNKWFSSTSKMHNSFMQNPNEVKFVTKLNRFERATTFIKERFSFEVHRKSYSRWKNWTFDFGLRKFSNMFDFPNFQLKIHHDTSFKWKSVPTWKLFPLISPFQNVQVHLICPK